MLEKGENSSSTLNSLLLYLVVTCLQGLTFLSFPQCFSLLSPVPPESAAVPVGTGSQPHCQLWVCPRATPGPSLADWCLGYQEQGLHSSWQSWQSLLWRVFVSWTWLLGCSSYPSTFLVTLEPHSINAAPQILQSNEHQFSLPSAHLCISGKIFNCSCLIMS